MNAYLALDIETTGLDPDQNQILEIGAVFNNPSERVIDCEAFAMLVNPGTIVGDPFALVMNIDLLQAIADNDGAAVPTEAAIDFLMDWLVDIRQTYGVDKFHLLGKNVGGFDLQFLKKVRGWRNDFFHYRHLEVGSMYATPEGIDGQGELSENVAHAYEIEGRQHSALYDARVSLALARHKWFTDGPLKWLDGETV